MYTASFPDGTIHAIRLPKHLYDALITHVDADGTLNAAAGIIQGNYLIYAGYKVKITKYDFIPATDTTPASYKVRLV